MSRATVLRIAVVLVAIGAIGLAWRMGWLARLAHPRDFARTLAEEGVRGFVVFVIAYALLQPFGVPGTVFIVAAPLIWPWPTAFALSMVGTMAASVIGFSFARFVARDFLSARIPMRFRKYDEALLRHALRTVVLLRMIFWMPQALHFFLGVSKVRGWTHFWGSLVGYVPPLFVVSYFGAQLFDEEGHMRSQAWYLLGGLVLASSLLVLTWRLVDRRRADLRA